MQLVVHDLTIELESSVKSLKTLARCTNGNLVPNLKCISPFNFQRSSACPFPNGNLIPVAGSDQGFIDH